MLSDRPYMQREHPQTGTGVLTWMLCALLAGFLVQNVFTVFMQGNQAFEDLFELSAIGIRKGLIWTILTYPLLHDGIFHLFFNGLAIFMFGREVVPLLGERRFVGFVLAAVAAGGLAWLAIHYTRGGAVIGASAVAIALLTLFACFFPRREITFLLFFVLPVTVRPMYLAWIVVGLDAFGLLFGELPGGRFSTGVAHSAHLGGALVAYLYFRFIHANNGWDRAASFQLPGWLKRSKPAAPASGTYQVNVTPKTKDLRAEVDRVLDKINSQGFGALTPEEKRILDEAKDTLSRR